MLVHGLVAGTLKTSRKKDRLDVVDDLFNDLEDDTVDGLKGEVQRLGRLVETDTDLEGVSGSRR